MDFWNTTIISEYRQERLFIILRWPHWVWSCRVMGAFGVFTGAVRLFVFPLLSHRPPHPETDSFGTVPLLYIIPVQYHPWFRRKTLNRARNTNQKNTENTGTGQAETASGVCPTNLCISAGSSRMKTTKLPYFIGTSRRFIFRSHKCFLLFSPPPSIMMTSWLRHLNKFEVEV
jgi:hypothetical protein